MKVLITGAGGRIGNELAALLGKRHELVLLGKEENKISSGHKSYSVDINATDKLAEILSDEKPQAIIHLAGLLSEACESDPAQAYKVNVEATKALARLAKDNGTDRFIFSSSSAVYKQTRLEPTDEQNNIEPQGVYAKTKLQAEEQLKSISMLGQTKFISLRLFNVYGANFEESLIYKLIKSSKAKPVLLYGPDNFYRDYIHISDVTAAFLKSLALATGTYDVFNIGSGRVLSNSQLVDKLRAKGYKPYFEIKKFPTTINWADISKAKQTFDFKPSSDLIFSDMGGQR